MEESALKIDWSAAKSEFVLKSDEYTSEYLYDKQQCEVMKKVNDMSAFGDFQKGKMSNKLISIIGERGSGKSSFLETTVNRLREQKFHVFNKIDPTIFNSGLSILELFISEIYREVNDNTDKYYSNRKLDLKEKVNFEIKKVITVLKTLRESKDNSIRNKPSIDILLEINKQTTFEVEIENLIKCFIDFKSLENGNDNCKGIVFFIDDLDLVTNEEAYRILEDLSKYLAKKVIIIIAYREVQMLNTVIDVKTKENKILIEQEYVDRTEIAEQAAHYLEKLLPKSQRVYLSVDNNSDKLYVRDIISPFIIDDYNLDERFDKNIAKFIQDELQKRTRIIIEPVDRKEATNLIYPKTLRAILQYLEIILSMEIPSEKETMVDVLLVNIEKYQNYFLSKMDEELNRKDMNLIHKWIGTGVESKNHLVCSSLLGRLSNMDLPKSLQTIGRRQVYNVTVADTYAIFEEYKREMSSETIGLHFIYSFKVLYSIELLKSFLELQKSYRVGDVLDSFDTNYEVLINGKIMPNGFTYNSDVISNDGKTLLVYKKENNSSEINFERNSLLEKLIFSNVAIKGDVREQGFNAITDLYTNGNQYQYRKFYANRDFNLTQKYSYGIDPFSLFTKRSYLDFIMEKFHSFLSKEEIDFKDNNFVFYSLFDIDVFVRKNYSRQSIKTQSKRIEYSLERVNDIFNRTKNRVEEANEWGDNLSKPLFNLIEDDKFCEVFSKTNQQEVQFYFGTENHLKVKEPHISDNPQEDIKVQKFLKSEFKILLDELLIVEGLSVNERAKVNNCIQITKRGGNNVTNDMRGNIQKIVDNHNLIISETGHIIDDE